MKCFGKHSATQRWSLKSFYLQRRLLKVLTHALTSTAETVYVSPRNTPSGKQTQPRTRKGSFKARITFPITPSLSYQKSSQTFKLKREENPKVLLVQKAKHMAVVLGYEKWMQHHTWCYCRQFSGMEETVERERDRHFVQTHMYMAFTKGFWDVSFLLSLHLLAS